MASVQLEKFDKVYDELYPHLLSQYRENEEYCDEVDLDPAKDMYRLLSDQGNLWIAVARELNEVVGYVVLLKQPHLHHQTINLGAVDIFYVVPEHRSTGVAVKLLDFIEKFSKIMEIKWLRIGMKTEQRFAKLLESRGYLEDEVVYCLDLEK